MPHAHVVTTTTHKTLRGPRGGMILSKDAELGKKINSAVFPGLQGGPLMHVIAAKAVSFGEALRPEFKVYGHRTVENARALAASLIERGLAIVSGGTDSHVMLVDLRPKRTTGTVAEKALDRAGITTNKNGIPNDPEKPTVTSGIRLGSPAGTTRGFGPAEFRQIGDLIADVLDGLAATASKAIASSSRRCAPRRSTVPTFSDLWGRLSGHHKSARHRGLTGNPMRCPFCGNDDTQVKDSRPTEDNSAIRRRRYCPACGSRFTTFERAAARAHRDQEERPARRLRPRQARALDRHRLPQAAGRSRAHRARGQRHRASSESSGESEIASTQIGELVMDALRALDPVAYVRFASVYKNFREAKDFEDFVSDLNEIEKD